MKGKHTEYRLNINVYYSFGSVLNDHVTGYSKSELEEKKKKYIAETKRNLEESKIELITFFGPIVTTVDHTDESLTETIKFVKKVKNRYAPENL